MTSSEEPIKHWPKARLSTMTIDDFKPRGSGTSVMAETAAAALRAKRGTVKPAEKQPQQKRNAA